MPIATNSLLNSLRVGYNDVFEKAKAAAPSQWATLATLVASTAASTTYGWLGQFPKLAEWTGQRSYKSMKEFGYSVTNKKYEASVKIPRTAFEDDTLDVYAPLFREMGYAAATHPDEIVFGLLKNGRTNDCFDGKKFFAADHPVYPNVDGTGSVANASNLIRPAAVSGTVTDKTAWYLLDVSRPLKPFIFQERTKPEIEAITSTVNNTVFEYDEYPFGIRYRCNGGYGFWQQAVCCTDDLTADNFELALATMQGFKADGGRPLGLGFGGKAGTLLVVPPTLQADARKILVAERDDMGASNIWFDAATIVVSPWLA
ncbi:Mu-like prophage major head subunit gpT family protein [Bilophila wadsworthia]|uniref:Mu-like prophage major head subunit gpT family protein n=1 Tax=Bilophila wadsworthia TaxID=35833 RepID=UPI000497326E|nr:Mu-like prophage major head subunit gpT family protein [Bilophila wadsworthia]